MNYRSFFVFFNNFGRIHSDNCESRRTASEEAAAKYKFAIVVIFDIVELIWAIGLAFAHYPLANFCNGSYATQKGDSECARLANSKLFAQNRLSL